MESSENPTQKSSGKLSRSTGVSKKLLAAAIAFLLLGGAGAGAWWWQGRTINDLRAAVAELEKQNSELKDQYQTEAPQAANWPEYVSMAGKFRVKYHPAWLLRVCEGNEATVFMAPDEQSQALCGSEKFSPISVTSVNGDQRSLTEEAVSEYGTDVAITEVTVSGVKGVRAAYTHQGNEFVAAGVKYVQYEFFSGGRTYIASYSDAESDQDLSADFEEVAKSFKFSVN